MGVGAPTAAAADEIPATSAKSPANIEKALGFFDQLNRDVREKARSKALTEQQIADANAAKGIKVEEVQEGTGSSAALPALKVNSDTMAWAQTRADELAERAVELTSLESPINHDNNKNGMPSRAGTVDADGDVVSSLLDHPDQQTGTYIFGPENLAAGYPSVDPVTGWTSELQTGEQGTNKPADKAAGGKKATKVVKGKSLAKTGVDALGLGVAVIALAGLGGAAAVTARKRAH